jgi:hypothetical protein
MTAATAAAAALFRRSGAAFAGTPRTNEKGRPYFVEQLSCMRCGGPGWSEKWRGTGLVCFGCGGTGKGKVETVKLYTAEELAKMNATRDAAHARKAAKLAAEVEDRRAEFLAARGETLAAARPYAGESEVLASIIAQADALMRLSDAQVETIGKCVAAVVAKRERDAKFAAQRAASIHVGTVGDAVAIDAEVTFARRFESQFGTMYVIGLRDLSGNAIVYKGSNLLGMSGIEDDGRGHPIVRGWRVALVATVKEHGERDGEKQTIIARPRKIAATGPAMVTTAAG